MGIEACQIVCCVCKKWRVGEEWLDPGNTKTSRPLSHTYCPECLKHAQAELKDK